ncbi:HAD family hydrolase [Nocardia africana]|uniref:Phosphoglycolate phosphatase n=1 Tax=Nocardia africana TaxID=134964 RepID=A0A378WRK0_9NOCA|nr:HAD family hydrolase [Nocardia africana]MCC3314757.1 HAD family hydrolase [Nocardia africana]SUA42963.1 phosphoglycolate phosphatase [Nocardia africana]
MATPNRRLLITDLDNTLWDWFHAWYEAYSVLITEVSRKSGLSEDKLESEIRTVHQRRGTSEYSNLLDEIPSLVAAAAPTAPHRQYKEALHSFRSRRKIETRLYPRVLDTLINLRSHGITIAGYTESQAFWTAWRIKHTGLDGIIDTLYSAEDHDLPEGMSITDLRTGYIDKDSYDLKKTTHRHTPKGATKPSPAILRSILDDQGASPHEAVYIGDSLMKDIAMAQAVDGVLDVHAKYGEAQNRPEYDLLRRVTHWKDEDVERERQLSARRGSVRPSLVCAHSFNEVLQAFEA